MGKRFGLIREHFFLGLCIPDDHDLFIAMETHSQTLVDTVDGVRRMIDACGPRLKVNLQIDDIAELSKLPDAAAVYKALKDHVVHFHLQPHGMAEWRQMYSELFAAMNADDCPAFICWEECSGESDPSQSARNGLKLMGELGV